MSYESRDVATVCENEVRIFGETKDNGRRPLLRVLRFPHYGAAVNYATEFDEAEKKSDERRR